MKITKESLKKIIKEEIEAVLQEDELQQEEATVKSEEYDRDAAIAQINAAMAKPMTKK
jgi:hypothetical protein